MGSSKREPCDFCGERTAVLFCRADTAKLCLPCDQQVHAANPLSRKHVRSQICDNCCKEPVSIRCVTENLILCQECDWDVHGSCSISVAHVRSDVDGFSGCPSAWELAALWGIDLEGRKEKNEVQLMMENFGMELDSWISGSDVAQELIVPNDVPFKKHGSTCGKYKQVMYKQLEELLKRVSISGDDGRDRNGDCDGGGDGGVGGRGDGIGGGEEIMVPEMPERLGWTRDLEEINGGTEAMQNSPTTSFTSLLMYPSEYEGGSGDGMQRNVAHPSGGQSSQIWDFHLGQSRGPEDPTRMEAAYVTKGATSWRIENFVDPMNETCSTNSKRVKEIHQDGYNRSSSGQGPATSENNNHPVIFGSKKGTNCSSDLQFGEDLAGACCKTTRLVATKADLEQLAQNRGNAMQRYKEKRKSRRFDKTIRYESRKARAETRLRVKGRFVKASEASYP